MAATTATTILSLPGGLKWNTKDIPENTRKHQFTRVRDGFKKVSYVSLSGATQMWKSGKPELENTIYILTVPGELVGQAAGSFVDLRIAGTPQDVNRAMLGVFGNNQDVVNRILQYAITPANYQTSPFKEAYDREIAARDAYKKTLAASKPKHYTLEMITFYGSSGNVKQANVNVGAARTGFGVGRSKDIRVMVAAILPNGEKYNPNNLRAIDVSKLDATTGHGGKEGNRPKVGGTSKKIHIPDLFPGIVSSDLEHYLIAINMVYPDVVKSPQGQQVIAQLQQYFQGRSAQQQAAPFGATGRVSVPQAWGMAPAQPMFQQAPGVPVTLPGSTVTGIPALAPL